MTADLIESPAKVLELLALIFQDLQIPYLVGGSIASSIQGEFRATNDIDLVCKLQPDNLGAFFKSLDQGFLYDDVAIEKAVHEKRSFNIFHEKTMMKVDIFTQINLFEEEQLKRAMFIELPESSAKIKVATPEDTILAKLSWYKLGNEVSDRQWRDIQGVLKVQGEKIDFTYLNQWAARLKTTALLLKALQEIQDR